MSVLVTQTFDSPKCCSGLCTPESNKKMITSQTPMGVVGVTTAASNAPQIVFATNQKLLLFNVLNNGSLIAGSLDNAIGSIGTSFKFTPAANVATGDMTAHVWVKDIRKGRKGCVRKIVWSWRVST